ncbi:interactor of HORMAD1 protein 1, partial [Carlito syrichta]|uniref:Interactor of HORMAD1 protein 1 n=1 Tax=Carlito syrichta TaxID=1868482 RepID=A0A1U7SX43_CARSF
ETLTKKKKEKRRRKCNHANSLLNFITLMTGPRMKATEEIVQETVQAQNDLVFEAVQDKGNMEQAVLEMQKRFETREAEFMEMKSNLKHLEVLVAQQSKDFQQLCEQLGQLNVPSVLAELKRFISMPQVFGHMKDSTSQTSPLLVQNLSSTRQKNDTSEEPIIWQGQALPAAWNPSMDSLQSGEFCVWDEETKSDAFRKETVLPAVGPRKGNGHAKNKAVQTNCNWDTTKTGPKYHGSSIPGHKVPGDRDLVSQGTSQLISLNLNNNIQNSCQKYQAKSMFLSDPCEQLVTKQKGKTIERRRKDNKQQPRKSHRGRLRAKKQEQIPSKTCAFNSKYQSPQPPVSGPQRMPLGQQELFAQPLHLQGPRSPIKSICPVLGGKVRSSKTTRAAQERLLQLSGCTSQDRSLLSSSSSQGDHQMSWFSDLNFGSSEPTLCKELGKNLLYDLGFDSSDDGF